MVHGFTFNNLGTVQEEYLNYLQQARSLPREMRNRGIQWVKPRYNPEFVVYADGTAEVPEKDQPLLARLNLKDKVTKRIGLESVGELLYYLTKNERGYFGIPKTLDHITSRGLRELSRILEAAKEDFTDIYPALVEKE